MVENIIQNSNLVTNPLTATRTALINKRTGSLNTLDADLASSIKELTGSYDARKNKVAQFYDNLLASNSQSSVQQLGILLYNNLTTDNEVLESRDSYSKVRTDPDFNRVVQIINGLPKIQDEERSSVLDSIFKGFGYDKIKQQVVLDSNEPKTINTYIAYSANSDSCYILVPTKKEALGLAKNLDSKIDCIMADNDIIFGATLSIAQGGNVLNSQVKTTTFEPDVDQKNNFTVYEFTRSDRKYIDDTLINAIVKKFNDDNIQPEGFKDAGLRHVMVQIDYPTAVFFMSHDIQEEFSKDYNAVVEGNLTIKEAADILGTNPTSIKVHKKRWGLDVKGNHVSRNSLESKVLDKKIETADYAESKQYSPSQSDTSPITTDERDSLNLYQTAQNTLESYVAEGKENISLSDAANLIDKPDSVLRVHKNHWNLELNSENQISTDSLLNYVLLQTMVAKPVGYERLNSLPERMSRLSITQAASVLGLTHGALFISKEKYSVQNDDKGHFVSRDSLTQFLNIYQYNGKKWVK